MKPLERLTRRLPFLAIIFLAAIMVLVLSSMSGTRAAAAGDDGTAIRPFRINVPEADLADLRRRLQTTRWPDKETVADASQGAQLANLQQLVRYWGRDYDWRRAEAKLNALPQFVTNIDGVDIHFIHVKSRHPNAMPLIITHGWPGSVFEQIKLIGPLTDPTAFGGRAEDAFDVVIPSLPGFGFSARPAAAGWGLERIGGAWDVLMKRLGYARYVAQGGDWGAGVVEAMGRQAPAGLLGIHTNLPAVITPEVGAALSGDGSALAAFSEKERSAINDLGAYLQNGGLAYLVMMGARPQAVGYGLTDSPAGLAGWMLVHSGFTKWTYGKDPKQSPTRDDVLDNFSLYWLTNTAASAARIYWENRNLNLISAAAQKTNEISVPVAITVFPDEVIRAQETWARRAFPNLIYFHEADRGGHFAMWEYPELFATELRAAFRSLRADDTLKSVNGIAFSEFKGYDAWQLIAASQAGVDGCGTSKVGCTKAILGNPVMIKAYRDGIPANGQPVPDGAAMAKVEWLKSTDDNSPYEVTVPGTLTEVAFMMKDSKRFPDTNGWGYATFQPDSSSGGFKPHAGHKVATFAKTLCHNCHTTGATKARDFVYTDFAKR